MTNKNKLSSLLSEYGLSHENPVNQKIHKVCVPLILLSLLGLLGQIPGPSHWASYALIALGLLYYSQFKNLSVFVVILSQVIPMMVVIHLLSHHSYQLWLGIFIVAWIGQFIGHKIEGKKPSFLKDIFFLLIGPLWVSKTFLKY